MLILAAFFLCELANAGENARPARKPLFNSPPVALTLQTNNLQLTPAGTMRAQLGLEFRPGWQAPLARATGDLYRLGLLRFDFGIANNVTIQIRGAIRQVLRFDEKPTSSLVASSSKTAHDVGDFTIATLARLIPAGKYRPAFGFRIETKLPNTNQERGIGANTTDVTMSVLATKQFGGATVFTDMGIGILTAPRHLNDQNDVLVYGIGTLWSISKKIQFVGEINGFVSPRQQIPLGTEDRSAVRLGVVWKLTRFSLEVLAVDGLTQREGNFGAIAGVSWQLNFK
jgi:hypothetical protein